MEINQGYTTMLHGKPITKIFVFVHILHKTSVQASWFKSWPILYVVRRCPVLILAVALFILRFIVVFLSLSRQIFWYHVSLGYVVSFHTPENISLISNPNFPRYTNHVSLGYVVSFHMPENTPLTSNPNIPRYTNHVSLGYTVSFHIPENTPLTSNPNIPRYIFRPIDIVS